MPVRSSRPFRVFPCHPWLPEPPPFRVLRPFMAPYRAALLAWEPARWYNPSVSAETGSKSTGRNRIMIDHTALE
ncbi:MAG: hypothetical protein Q7U96_02385, partial [Chloroflexota bacterium]|nr:hypothetical protein [Chloroflexota bacterium]